MRNLLLLGPGTDDVTDHLKQALPHMCYHAKFGHCALKQIGIQENPQNWEELELRSLGMGGVANPSPHVLILNGVVIDRREPPKLGIAENLPPPPSQLD